ncbi:MAG: DUF3617 family protein, partial [Betaproteobacteria bacterium]
RAAAWAAALAALAPSSAVQAQGADDLYEVTVKMEMAGMPMQMPAMTQRACVKKGASDADAVPHQDNCKVTDTRRTGSKLSFSVVCTGRDAMSGTGEFTYAGDGYSGTIRLKGKMEGQDMEMTQSIVGRRVGGCTAR